jgi:hypothetical protein
MTIRGSVTRLHLWIGLGVGRDCLKRAHLLATYLSMFFHPFPAPLCQCSFFSWLKRVYVITTTHHHDINLAQISSAKAAPSPTPPCLLPAFFGYRNEATKHTVVCRPFFHRQLCFPIRP